MPTGTEIREDEAFVERQGQLVILLNQDRARATWYKPDGTALPNLPTDMYHRTRYRKRGWTLVPPSTLEIAVAEARIAKAMVPEDSPAMVAYPKPPKHMHVYETEMLGSICLVRGCGGRRQNPKGSVPIRLHEGKKPHEPTA